MDPRRASLESTYDIRGSLSDVNLWIQSPTPPPPDSGVFMSSEYMMDSPRPLTNYGADLSRIPLPPVDQYIEQNGVLERITQPGGIEEDLPKANGVLPTEIGLPQVSVQPITPFKLANRIKKIERWYELEFNKPLTY